MEIRKNKFESEDKEFSSGHTSVRCNWIMQVEMVYIMWAFVNAGMEPEEFSKMGF